VPKVVITDEPLAVPRIVLVPTSVFFVLADEGGGSVCALSGTTKPVGPVMIGVSMLARTNRSSSGT